jgi:uncharacterized membrane protein
MQSRARPRVARTRAILPLRLARTLPLLVAMTGCAAASRDDHESTSAPQASAGAPNHEASIITWCAAREVLGRKCTTCHSAPPAHGAPFPLVTYEDALAQNAKGVPRYERIAKVLAAGSMPPDFIQLEPPAEPLNETERELLAAWCAAGAPLGDDCEP